jgi:uncharacterized membrane protein
MTLAPLLAAPLHIKLHIGAAVVVAGLTPFQFWIWRKGSLPHRASGIVWMAAMLVVAGSSFWITSTFPKQVFGFGPIHLLSILAFYSVATAILHARAHRIRAHQMTLLFLTIGFWIAGAFTLVPSRLIGRVLFG